jgi:glutamate-1-semialdehyde 2,1-aminomutase
MPDAALIDEVYAERYPKSRTLYERHRELTPGGTTHIARAIAPFPLFIEWNRGSRKRDVDGFEYVDYWMGHGAILLGHAHPTIAEAIAKQAPDGFHAGGESALAIEWAELVQSLVPSAETTRFVATGGEATQLAIRVARAYTGKDRIVKFQGGFHGWHDAACIGVLEPFEIPYSPGLPNDLKRSVVAVPFHDIDAVESVLLEGDVAAIIVEPGGLYGDTVPTHPPFLAALRELATAEGVVLIFDEVVSGFRYARGGVQERFGVTPDLTTLGKIIGGGLPAGALVGAKEIMDVLGWRPDPDWSRFGMIPLPGTWNAAPAVAAAGVATLEIVRDTDAVQRAIDLTARLVEGCNEVFLRLGIDGFAYGRASMFKLYSGRPPALLQGDMERRTEDTRQLIEGWGPRMPLIRKALLLEGADFMRTAGAMSAAHTEQDIDETCDALERALVRVRAEVDL